METSWIARKGRRYVLENLEKGEVDLEKGVGGGYNPITNYAWKFQGLIK